MNRDELRSRPEALPPRFFHHGGVRRLCPSEREGGTWIGINEHGVCLALINWHAVRQPEFQEPVSRGMVIPELLRSSFLGEVRRDLAQMHLGRTAPFRLIAISLGEERLLELRWDGRQIEELPHGWGPRHWFSSGYNEGRVQVERDAVCRAAWLEPDAGSLSWLRRLHASHEPERGPFSICMHRLEAATVSYTEVEATRLEAAVSYEAGPLCLCKDWSGDSTNFPRPHERATLRLRPAGGALSSRRLPSCSVNHVHAARGGDAIDESNP